MQIRARMSMSADGYVTTPGGWPALTADPAFVSGSSHGIREFLAGCEAALTGRTTFDLPWPTTGGRGRTWTFTCSRRTALGALDRLELVVLPLLFGPGCS